MAGLNDIVRAPDERLSTACAPVETIDDATRALAGRMLEDMYAADGCGLAAPQIGELVQMIVIDVDYADGPRNPYVLVNPRVIVADGPERTTSEGCLSFPGISVGVTRPSHVVVEATNLDGELMRYEAQDNLLAVCLQHEIDHLRGVTMVDHLSPLRRVSALRAYQEALAAGARPGETAVE
ncbi:peptide deformylase [Olsenella massiliensis]|uniref:peptide deformylase n=1 Tax=Olsenella massiliensis TaxID=1622075 RepID=UPI00071D6DE2|nr:peptide deformylase [Olsenella massiliensis]